MRYNEFTMLPERAFEKRGFGRAPATLEGGGSGGGGPTQSTVTQSNVPEWLRPQTEALLGSAMQTVYNTDTSGNITGFKPYTPYSTSARDYVADFSPLQQQSFQGASQLQTPGQFGVGSNMAAQAGTSALGAGQQYNEMATNPYAQQAFMSPYIQNALTPQLEEMQRQYGITGTQEAGKASAAGAFGGNRQALMQAENQRNKNMAMNQAIGQGYQNAFQAAQQAQQFGANLGLQGAAQANQAAGTMGQLGSQQLAAQQGILGTQNQYGAQQQQQQQNILNQAIQNYANAQMYPQQQASFLNSLIRGYATPTQSTQTYQAAPSPISQAAGLGTTALAGYKLATMKEGGQVSDGIDDLGMYNAMKGQ